MKVTLEDFKSDRKSLEDAVHSTREYIYQELQEAASLSYSGLISKVSQSHSMMPFEARQVVDAIVRHSREGGRQELANDGQCIMFKHKIIQCPCGARHSSKMRKCPSCGTGVQRR